MDKIIEQKAKAYDKALERAKEFYILCKKCGAKDTVDFLEDNFPELCESEDEKVKKEITELVMQPTWKTEKEFYRRKELVAWLEKQGSNLVENGYTNNKDVIEYAGNYSREIWHKLMDNFKNIKDYHIGCNDVSDIVLNAIINTYNWLKKHGEDVPMAVMDEQKPADNFKPKFNIGDWVMLDRPVLITKVEDMPYNTHQYWTSDGTWFGDATKSKLWTIQDAKDGDVLVVGDEDGTGTAICGKNDDLGNNILCCYYDDENGFAINTPIALECLLHPATKEQRDMLFKKMHKAGYMWNAEKKELKKIEQSPSWSEEDEEHLNSIISDIKTDMGAYPRSQEVIDIYNDDISFLKSLKDRVQPQSQWKPSDEQLYTLNWIATNVLGDGVVDKKASEILYTLYDDLKKL